MTSVDQKDYAQRVDSLLDDAPVQCDWQSMDLRTLASPAVLAQEEKKAEGKTPVVEDHFLYNVGDHVLVKADRGNHTNFPLYQPCS